MRHMAKRHSFGRRTGAKAALFKGLVNSLVEHERIHTTLAKAKEIRRHVEKAVTLGKKGDIGTRRLLISKFGNQDTANKLVNDISKRFETRPGGYTRILKTGLRAGDSAPMAYLEFVDYELPETAKGGDEQVVGDAGASKKARAENKARQAKRKRIRKIQAASRARNRK